MDSRRALEKACMIAVLLFSSQLGAQDLIVPLSDKDVAEVKANNEYAIKKETYFAKRHWIAKMDPSVLRTSGRFKISLFDDAVLTVRSKNVKERQNNADWQGEIIDPVPSESDLKAAGMTEKDAIVVGETLSSIELTLVSWDRDKDTGETAPSSRARAGVTFEEASGRDQHNLTRLDRFERKAFESVRADISNPVLSQGGFIIRSIVGAPEFHIVMELDPDKVYGQGNSDEIKARHRRYKDFIRDLGPDPKSNSKRRDEK